MSGMDRFDEEPDRDQPVPPDRAGAPGQDGPLLHGRGKTGQFDRRDPHTGEPAPARDDPADSAPMRRSCRGGYDRLPPGVRPPDGQPRVRARDPIHRGAVAERLQLEDQPDVSAA
ncbi:MAG: hypothetical protein Q4G40_03610, partial [Brachybacterium sp.]|nr:hypothetical protein [Brachybacterium sp.]